MEIANYYQGNWRTALLVIVFCALAVTVSVLAYAKEPLLIIRTEGKDFEQAVLGLSEETEKNFFISEMVADKKTSTYEIARKMKTVSPKIVVLMDNISVFLYKKYQKELPDSAMTVPSVSLMGAFVDMAVKGMRNATGILYEVPLVTSVVNLRPVLPSVSFDRVGIVHREFMKSTVSVNKMYCAKKILNWCPIRYRIKKISDQNSRTDWKNLERKEKLMPYGFAMTTGLSMRNCLNLCGYLLPGDFRSR